MKTITALCRRAVLMAALAAVLVAAPGAARAQAVRNDLLRNNSKIVRLFRSVVADARESTVRVRCSGKDVALGTIMSADGYVLTKASELSGKVACVTSDGTEYPATVVGEEKEFDLALLKVDADDLKPIVWDDSKAARVGRWVASVGTGADPVAIGVISVAARKFKLGDQPPKEALASSGWLGVGLDNDTNGARVTQVERNSPADKAGLRKDDVITHINGKKVAGVEFMIASIQKRRPGEEINLSVLRDEEEMEFKATLEKRPAKFLAGNPQERMGSVLSSRRGGFPVILQHDTVIKPADCGGPLVDLDGKAVGVNISRAGRTETYAIPGDTVRSLLARLKSGELAPKREEN